MPDSRPLRIAYGRIQQETNAFSPIVSTVADFEHTHFLRGAALVEATASGGAEVPGYIRNAELSGFRQAVRRLSKQTRRAIEAVPLLSAWAHSSGPLTEGAYDELRAQLIASLREAGKLDGVFLAMHGAMRGTTEIPEPEEGFLAAIRGVVGPDVPVAVTLDLHAQLSPRKVDPTTILAGYRTNPHRDLARTGRRTGELLIRTVLKEVRPTSTWRSLPMVLGGGTTIDFLPTMWPIFRRMKAMERDPRVLYVSLFMCHIWNDSPDLGWSVHVITDDDPALADELADELAERAWKLRTVKAPRFRDAKEGLERVRKSWVGRKTGTICVSDVSDVVGAGAPGDNTHLLRELVEGDWGLIAFVPIRDAETVSELWSSGEGAEVTATVGGRYDPKFNPAFEVTGRVLHRAETDHYGRVVVLDLGDVKLVVTELAPFTLKPSFYGDLGLNVWKADLVVVKSIFHFHIYFAAVNRRTVAIRTRGFTDMNMIERIDFNDPVHPLHEVADWRLADRRRRQLGE